MSRSFRCILNASRSFLSYVYKMQLSSLRPQVGPPIQTVNGGLPHPWITFTHGPRWLCQQAVRGGWGRPRRALAGTLLLHALWGSNCNTTADQIEKSIISQLLTELDLFYLQKWGNINYCIRGNVSQQRRSDPGSSVWCGTNFTHLSSNYCRLTSLQVSPHTQQQASTINAPS